MQMPNGLIEDQQLADLIDFGDEVGKGTTRKVYGVKGAPDLVIKESYQPFHHGNFVEWIVWQAVQKMAGDIIGNERNPELHGLFAQALAISHSGKFLLMERLHPLDDFPPDVTRKFPGWLNDRKPSAFGLAENGQIKVMDYAMVDFYHVLNPLNGPRSF